LLKSESYMDLPEPYLPLLKPLYQHLPLDQAMGELVPTRKPDSTLVLRVEALIAAHVELSAQPALCAGLWLYVDDLDRSHGFSQGLETSTGSFWHAIMHRREGDFGNSHYWYSRAGLHPAMTAIPGFDPQEFVDEVAAHSRQNPQPLVSRQRLEWAALFKWCAEEAAAGI
jgi:hypothetical protein